MKQFTMSCLIRIYMFAIVFNFLTNIPIYNNGLVPIQRWKSPNQNLRGESKDCKCVSLRVPCTCIFERFQVLGRQSPLCKFVFLCKIYLFTLPITAIQQSWGNDLALKVPRKPASENVISLCHLLNILANFPNLFLHIGKQCGP